MCRFVQINYRIFSRCNIYTVTVFSASVQIVLLLQIIKLIANLVTYYKVTACVKRDKNYENSCPFELLTRLT